MTSEAKHELWESRLAWSSPMQVRRFSCGSASRAVSERPAYGSLYEHSCQNYSNSKIQNPKSAPTITH
jgi:hypothetical protein